MIVGVILLMVLSGCSSPQSLGGVRLRTNVPEATLFIDDELRGPVREYLDEYLPLDPGPHLIVLEHPGYAPERMDIIVSDGIAMEVSIEMRQRSQHQER